MKRTVITVDGNGRFSIPSNLEDLWMSESELIDIPMVVAICFRLNSNGAAQLRDAIIKRLYGAKEKTNIVLQLYGGTNSFS